MRNKFTLWPAWHFWAALFVVTDCPPHSQGTCRRPHGVQYQSAAFFSQRLSLFFQVSTLALGSQDEDYPFACSPGTVGGTDKNIETQLSHVCSGACPAGSMCHSATRTPQRTPRLSRFEPRNIRPQRRAAAHSSLPAWRA